jgi:SAM-dependent methyltransferase
VRKDYVQASARLSETSFVAEMWDGVWSDQAATAVRRAALRRGEEYRFLRDHVLGGHPEGLDILDCGCGTGDWTLLLREDGHRATGIDIASGAVARLREAHGDWFRLSDFRSTGLADSSFDVVLNWGGLEHFEEGPSAGIQEAWRLLRPGGALVATTPFHNLRLFLMDAWGGGAGGPDYPLESFRFYQYRFTRAELESLFRAGGFEGVRSRALSGAQGMSRMLQHELKRLGQWLPGRAQALLIAAGGRLLRPILGHMVICVGRKRQS